MKTQEERCVIPIVSESAKQKATLLNTDVQPLSAEAVIQHWREFAIPVTTSEVAVIAHVATAWLV